VYSGKRSIKPGFLAPRIEVEEHSEQRGRREAERGIGKATS
jgi:hypothetical protein